MEGDKVGENWRDYVDEWIKLNGLEQLCRKGSLKDVCDSRRQEAWRHLVDNMLVDIFGKSAGESFVNRMVGRGMGGNLKMEIFRYVQEAHWGHPIGENFWYSDNVNYIEDSTIIKSTHQFKSPVFVPLTSPVKVVNHESQDTAEEVIQGNPESQDTAEAVATSSQDKFPNDFNQIISMMCNLAMKAAAIQEIEVSEELIHNVKVIKKIIDDINTAFCNLPRRDEEEKFYDAFDGHSVKKNDCDNYTDYEFVDYEQEEEMEIVEASEDVGNVEAQEEEMVNVERPSLVYNQQIFSFNPPGELSNI